MLQGGGCGGSYLIAEQGHFTKDISSLQHSQHDFMVIAGLTDGNAAGLDNEHRVAGIDQGV